MAQDLTLEAGGLHARYADSVSGTAGHVGVRLNLFSRRASALFDAGLSRFTSGETVSQVVGRGSVFATSSPRSAVGVQWGGEWNRLSSDSWVGIGSIGPLIGFGSEAFTASVGGMVGGFRRLTGSSDVVGSVGATLERHWTGSFSAHMSGSATVSDTIRYADFTAGLRVRYRGLLLSISGGARAGDLSDDPWGQVRADYAVTPWVNLEGAVGRYPRDLMGFTDGVYGIIGVRVALVGKVASRGGIARVASPRPPVGVETLPDGRRRITFRYAGAPRQGMVVVGNWNGWTPVPLEALGENAWFVDLPLAPGLYRYQLVVDGDTWTIPEGAAWVPDDFGGRVGLLVVR
jgi:hypothetical protein